jgi:DNA replication protein DnaC
MLTHPLLPKLKALKLSGMSLTLDTRAGQASQEQLSPVEFLALLLDDELERRQQHRLQRVLGESGVDPSKSLAQFDFGAVPQLNRHLVMELASGGFIARGENWLTVGPSGVGKSHLAHAIAFEALKRGQSVYLGSAHRVLADLHAARADGTFARRFTRLCTVDLLVLDDFALLPLPPHGAEDLYEIIRERYERRSMAMTSNRALQEWPPAFGDSLLASAALDRLTHHAHTLAITGQSFRQRGRRKEETFLNSPPEPPAEP